METKPRTYICIDLKSFYASVECVKRHLDPLTTNLVVADLSRTEKTICLAVSPSLKAYHIPGRARLFEVVQKVKEINLERRKNNHYKPFLGSSVSSTVLSKAPELELSYIAATPAMADYIKVSASIYNIYLKYVAKEDIHVYSIDEVFMDVTDYLKAKNMNAHQLAMTMIQDVLKHTGITATAGIGTNMYLAKVAMDIVAKHIPADKDGVRIAALDEMEYRKLLWDHTPLKDFWRVGRGYVKRLHDLGLYTMGDIARCSLSKDKDLNEDTLYKEFGVNAELLIDHAWGIEPTTIKDIKAYKPQNNSISSGQVLHCPYDYAKAKIIVTEMADELSMQLVEKKMKTNEIALYIGYDASSLETGDIEDTEISSDWYGRSVPKAAHGSYRMNTYTYATSEITHAALSIFEEKVNPDFTVRRVNIVAVSIIPEDKADSLVLMKQTSLFEDEDKVIEREKEEKKRLEKESRVQQTILQIKKKYGKNSILKATDYEEGANTRERNKQIGGHKA